MTDVHTTRTLYERLLVAGFEPSADACRLYDAMTQGPTPDEVLDEARSELRAAMLDGDSERVARAQTTLSEVSNVRDAWASFQNVRLDYAQKLIRSIAADAFAHVRECYDSAGAALEASIATVDPDADAAEVMTHGPKAEREEWAALPVRVAHLDTLAQLLEEIARQCGDYSGNATDAHGARGALGLFVTPGDADRRSLVQVWTWRGYTPEKTNPKGPGDLDRLCTGTGGDGSSWGRGGKWAALVRLGAQLAVPFERLSDYRPMDDGKNRKTVGLRGSEKHAHAHASTGGRRYGT